MGDDDIEYNIVFPEALVSGALNVYDLLLQLVLAI